MDSQQGKVVVVKDGALFVLDDCQGVPKYYMATIEKGGALQTAAATSILE